MTPYSVFARYYDLLTGDVDYDGQLLFLQRAFERFDARPQLVLDLACGTGSLSAKLADAGYELVCVDASPQMLAFASQKLAGNDRAALICQRMESLDLFGTVDAAVCFLDGVNHLTTPRKALAAFERVSLFLNPGGLFLFDLNSPFKFEQTLRDNVFVYDYDDIYCVWQNQYNARSKLCRFDLTFFEKQGSVYSRTDESFCEKAYTTAQVARFLKTAGLEMLEVFDGFSFDAPKEDSQRLVFAARKGTKA